MVTRSGRGKNAAAAAKLSPKPATPTLASPKLSLLDNNIDAGLVVEKPVPIISSIPNDLEKSQIEATPCDELVSPKVLNRSPHAKTHDVLGEAETSPKIVLNSANTKRFDYLAFFGGKKKIDVTDVDEEAHSLHSSEDSGTEGPSNDSEFRSFDKENLSDASSPCDPTGKYIFLHYSLSC